MTPSVLGLDIGGANLKAAHSTGVAVLQPFELWKHPADLPLALQCLRKALPPCDLLAVTMTGELCDCFASRREGVLTILHAVAATAGDTPVQVWQIDGRFVSLAAARDRPMSVAAANWLALATFAGRCAPHGSGLLVDVGSTTTDIIALVDGRPIPRGQTDLERLRTRELIYTGVRRTPVCVLLGPTVAAEWFATTLDVYLVLGAVAEDPSDRGTADGRPATREAAHARLAHLLCADAETCSEEVVQDLARQAHDSQRDAVAEGIRAVADSLPGWPQIVLVAGSGEFLARAALATTEFAGVCSISLAERLGLHVSQAACAYAVAVLAAEKGES